MKNLALTLALLVTSAPLWAGVSKIGTGDETVTVDIPGLTDKTQMTQLTDGYQGNGISLNGFRIPKTSLETLIFQEGFSNFLNTEETWETFEVGNGTVTIVDGQGEVSTSGIGDSFIMQTQVPHAYAHGFSNLWRVRLSFDIEDIVTGSTCAWGIFNVNDGYFFLHDADGLQAVIRRKGIDTKISSSTWDHQDDYTTAGPAQGYAIQYLDGNRVVFWFNGVPVVTRGSQTGSLVAESRLTTRIENVQTESVGDRTMIFTGLAVLREGAPFQFDTTGRLRVSGGVAEAPEGTTEVVRPPTPKITIGPNSVTDDVYTITANTTLILQVLDASSVSAGTGKSVIVELFDDPNGDLSVLIPIPGGIFMGNNFNADRVIDKTFTGDGVRRIVLRTTQDGSATMIVARSWRGFEQ